jgi:hypothetical protein
MQVHRLILQKKNGNLHTPLLLMFRGTRAIIDISTKGASESDTSLFSSSVFLLQECRCHFFTLLSFYYDNIATSETQLEVLSKARYHIFKSGVGMQFWLPGSNGPVICTIVLCVEIDDSVIIECGAGCSNWRIQCPWRV